VFVGLCTACCETFRRTLLYFDTVHHSDHSGIACSRRCRGFPTNCDAWPLVGQEKDGERERERESSVRGRRQLPLSKRDPLAQLAKWPRIGNEKLDARAV
jgi:hypothetical protein